MTENATSIMAVYSVENPQDITGVINDRIRGTITETIKRQQEIDRLTKLAKCYEDGRPFPPSEGAETVIKAIATYKEDYGSRLATYAARCIDNELLMYFRAKKKVSRCLQPLAVQRGRVAVV